MPTTNGVSDTSPRAKYNCDHSGILNEKGIYSVSMIEAVQWGRSRTSQRSQCDTESKSVSGVTQVKHKKQCSID